MHSIISKVYQLYSINFFFVRKFKGCSIRASSFKLIRTPTQKILRRQKYIIFSQISPILSQFETKTIFSGKSSTTNSNMIFSETNDDRKSLQSLPVSQKLRVLCFFTLFMGISVPTNSTKPIKTTDKNRKYLFLLPVYYKS